MTDKHGSNLIHELAAAKRCPGGMVEHLTESELAALHAFKHEVVAAGFRLYQNVSSANADPVIRHFVKPLLDGR